MDENYPKSPYPRLRSGSMVAVLRRKRTRLLVAHAEYNSLPGSHNVSLLFSILQFFNVKGF